MTDKVILTNLANLQNETTAVTAINANNAAITTAMNNTLSRDGTSPNTMGAPLDMNSNRIINLPTPVGSAEPLRIQDLSNFLAGTAFPASIRVTGITNFTTGVGLIMAYDGVQGDILTYNADTSSYLPTLYGASKHTFGINGVTAGPYTVSITSTGLGIGANPTVGPLEVHGLIYGQAINIQPIFQNANYIFSVSGNPNATLPVSIQYGTTSSPWLPSDINNSYVLSLLSWGSENTNNLTGLRVGMHKVAPSTAGGSTIGAEIIAYAETGLTYTGNPNKDALIGMDLNVIAHSKVDMWGIATVLSADVATNNIAGWELDVGSSVSAVSKWLYIAQSIGADTGTVTGTQTVFGGSGDTLVQSAAFVVTASGNGFAQGLQFVKNTLAGSTAPVTANLIYGGGFSVPYGVNFGRMTFSQAAILLPNTGAINSFNAAGNAQFPLISLNASNLIAVGNNMTVDPTTGAITSGLNTVTRVTVSNNGFGATSTDGIALQNAAVATAGAQQWSPRLRFTGQGWKTNATAGSQQVDWAIENAPVQGTASPSTNLLISSQINGGGFVSQFAMTSGGLFSASTGYQINQANATAGNVLRGDGTKFVAAILAAADLSNGVTGSGAVVLASGAALTTATINGNTFTTGTYTLTGTAAKTLTFSNTLTLAGTDSTTITFQGTDTYVGRATTDTLTNKTYDTAGTGNVFKINGTTISANTGTGSNVLATSPTITTPNIVGSATNDAAAAGSVGESIASTLASGSAISLTNNIGANVTSVSLTAGDWEVSGIVYYAPAATTNVTLTNSSTSTTSATNSVTAGQFTVIPFGSSGIVTTGANITGVMPPFRISLSSTTTVYLVAFAGFTVSTLTAYGHIHARRMR